VNSYDEYGMPASGNTGLFGYTGQVWLPQAGLYHYRARAYSPALGRFLQTDPIGMAGGMNLYAYVGNDPINGIDPLGLQSQDDDDIVVPWDPCWNTAVRCYGPDDIDDVVRGANVGEFFPVRLPREPREDDDESMTEGVLEGYKPCPIAVQLEGSFGVQAAGTLGITRFLGFDFSGDAASVRFRWTWDGSSWAPSYSTVSSQGWSVGLNVLGIGVNLGQEREQRVDRGAPGQSLSQVPFGPSNYSGFSAGVAGIYGAEVRVLGVVMVPEDEPCP
jgi:RHS repeat-associated protein